jgi:pilus assembly protein Flp/PilA
MLEQPLVAPPRIRCPVARGGRVDITTPREDEVQNIKLAASRFVRDEEGAALAEYGILIAFIAIAAIVAVTFFGDKIKNKFSQLGNTFS